MAIDRLAYKLVMDHKQFTDGAIASRKELNLAKQVMYETQTPAQRYQKQIDSLGGLLRKGAIDQRQYNEAVRQLKNPASAAGKSLTQQAAAFVKLNPALAAAAAATAAFYAAQQIARKVISEVTGAIKKQFEEINTIQDAADKLGITSEAFVTLNLEVSRAGIGQDKLTTSLQRMVRKIGDAQRGIGEAVKTFEQLGLSASDLALLPVEQQFLAVSAAIGKFSTHTERLSATVKVFDSEGAELVRILGLTEEGFESVRQQAEAMGLTFDDIDAAGIKEANIATADLKAVMTGLARTAAIELGPSVAVAAEMMKEFTLSKDGVNEVKDAIKEATKWIKGAAIFTEVWVKRLEKARQIASLLDPLENLRRTNRAAGLGGGLLPDLGGGKGSANAAVSQVDSFFDEFEKRVAKKKAELTAKFSGGTDGASLIGDILTGTKATDGKYDPIADMFAAGSMPDFGEAQREIDKMFLEGAMPDFTKKATREAARFAGAITSGSQQDIAMRAAASGIPGANKDTAIVKTADLMGKAVAVLEKIESKTEGVVVSELTELPT